MIGSNSQGVRSVCEAKGRKGDGGAGAPRNSGVGNLVRMMDTIILRICWDFLRITSGEVEPSYAF
jgi:hypothetical protein